MIAGSGCECKREGKSGWCWNPGKSGKESNHEHSAKFHNESISIIRAGMSQLRSGGWPNSIADSCEIATYRVWRDARCIRLHLTGSVARWERVDANQVRLPSKCSASVNTPDSLWTKTLATGCNRRHVAPESHIPNNTCTKCCCHYVSLVGSKFQSKNASVDDQVRRRKRTDHGES